MNLVPVFAAVYEQHSEKKKTLESTVSFHLNGHTP